MDGKNQKRAMLLGVSAVLLWSTVATAFKLALQDLTPLQLLSIASVTSVAVLLLAVIRKHPWCDVVAYWKKAPLKFAVLGALNPFLYYVILFQAYDLLPAQQAQPLNYTWALVLSLLAVPILGQSLQRSDIVALVLGYFGVLVISTRGDLLGMEFDSGLGVALALISTVLWALYWLINAKNATPSEISLLLCFLNGTPLVLLATLLVDGMPSGMEGVLSAVYVGFFEMGITFMLWMNAMKLATHTSRVSNLIFLSPFLSLILIHSILGEEIGGATYIGLVMIVSAVAYQQYAAYKTKPQS
ncbi:DMT family transporter [Neptunomonas japonica]|uniref:Drug/metabolite exporter, DME Family n=1 Tax=Neptunomonas japonica JAMM 1380 TaxID=1441457 RepID=A0A7R6PEL0_9GAMM|nr:DMT family transporter [Neptunomonas japonica]BBB31074.1 drug/metabolite exporter, DME Family [Neptunomonas japonica JAMM 1380]